MKDSESILSDEHFPSSQGKQTKDALVLCNKLLQDFKDRADRHKRTFKLLRYTSVALVTAVTIISTFTAIREIDLWIVPVVSGLSALSTTLLSTNNSQERWVHSRGVQAQLEAERFLYLQRAGVYATPDEEANVRIFSERVVAIWSEAQQGWAQSVAKVSYGLSSSPSKESKLLLRRNERC
jgi:hypothetical protein